MKYCKNCKQNIEPKLNKIFLGIGGIFIALFFVAINDFRLQLYLNKVYIGPELSLYLYGPIIFVYLIIGLILLLAGLGAIAFGIIDKRCPICNSKNSDIKSKE